VSKGRDEAKTWLPIQGWDFGSVNCDRSHMDGDPKTASSVAVEQRSAESQAEQGVNGSLQSNISDARDA